MSGRVVDGCRQMPVLMGLGGDDEDAEQHVAGDLDIPLQ
jgi:hypothetical protein